MTVVQVLLRLQKLCTALQLLLLLLLPLQLLHASPCPTTVEEFTVATTSDAEELSEALLCDGPGRFVVSWHGNVILSRTLSVSNGSTLSVAGSSDSTDGDSSEVILSDGTVLLFEIDSGSTVSLTGLTFSGGDGAVRVNRESFIEVVDCNFMDNNRTSSNSGGAFFVNGSNVVLKGETVFMNNTADYGGAIYLTESSEFNVKQGGSVSFVNNHAADYGGAIRLNGHSVFNSYGNASFVYNKAQSGGAINGDGGSEVNFIGGVSFEGNDANISGGAVYTDGDSNALFGGEAFFDNNTATYGGAMFCTGRSELNVTEAGSVSFSSNYATEYGGAVEINGSEVNFIGSVSFEGNHANMRGGAFYAEDGSNALFGGEAIFVNNTAAYGGAIYSRDSSELNVTEGGSVSFSNNHAADYGGAIRLYNQSVFNSYGTASFVSNKAEFGGAIIGYGSEASFIGSVSFEGNHANLSGGAVCAEGDSNVLLGGEAFFANNTATNGGAIFLYSQTVFNSYNTASFVSNEAEFGGAIYGYGSEANFIGSVSFKGNHANISGGAVYAEDDSNALFGGEAVFANNTATNGGAIYLYNQTVFNSYSTASFVSNEAEFGGAISGYGSEANFIGSISFEGNHANITGGAVYADDDSNVLFGGEAVFANNTATFAGAIFCTESSELNFTEGGSVYFSNNYAAINGGAISIYNQSGLSSYGTASFVSNEAEFGGAFEIDGSRVNFIGSVSFKGNHANISGGAAYAEDHSNALFEGEAIFVNNTAKYGGGIFGFDTKVFFIGNATFKGNYAVEYGGAVDILRGSNFVLKGEQTVFAYNMATFGGAFYLNDGSELNVKEAGSVSFYKNRAGGSGGAVALDDGSIIYIEGVTLFVENEAIDDGGAIYASESSVFVETGTLFMSNVAYTGSGGGVYASISVIALTGAAFIENYGAWGGGVAFFSCGFPDEKSDGILSLKSTSTAISDEETDDFGPSYITGCRYDGNVATNGGAIYTTAGYDVVVNSVFTRNFAAVQGGALLHTGTLEALTKCTFESNMAGEDGLAVMSFGIINNITDLTFRNNSFFCASGKYGLEENIDELKEFDTSCRWDLVCSYCTDPQCNVPVDIDIDNITVPVCEEVPEGVDTTGKPGMTLETLNLMPGFYRTYYKSREVLKCHREGACVGGSKSSRYCAKGYTGPYCAACDEGYGSGFQYSCHSCHGSDKWTTIGGAVAVFVVVVFVAALGVAYLVGVVERPLSERSGRWERRVSSFRDGLVRAIPLTAIKIVLVSLQIITQFSGVVNVQYPPAYEKFLKALSVVNLNLGSILSLSCVVETNFYARLILATITPVAALGVLVITYRVAMLRNAHSTLAKRMARNKHLAVGLFLLFMVYSSVSYTIFQTFVCDPLDSGVTYLRADYDLACWTGTHVAYMSYAGIMIIVYPVGIPAVFAWVLYKYRESIKRVVAGTTSRTQVPPEAEAIKDLWVPYKRSRCYYEVIECGRRIVLTGLAVFIYPGSTAQVVIEALLAFVFSSVSEILSPFAEPLDAWLYRSGTWVIFLSMFLALLLKMEAADEQSHSHNMFAVFLIVAHVIMMLVVIANALLSGYKGYTEVRAIEMPSRTSRSVSSRDNGIGMFEEDEEDTSKYNANTIVAERRPTNFAPL